MKYNLYKNDEGKFVVKVLSGIGYVLFAEHGCGFRVSGSIEPGQEWIEGAAEEFYDVADSYEAAWRLLDVAEI